MSVFRNYKTNNKVKDNVIRDAHPNNTTYKWQPNRPEFFRLVMPHEKGNFFRREEKSGAGAQGVPEVKSGT